MLQGEFYSLLYRREHRVKKRMVHTLVVVSGTRNMSHDGDEASCLCHRLFVAVFICPAASHIAVSPLTSILWYSGLLQPTWRHSAILCLSSPMPLLAGAQRPIARHRRICKVWSIVRTGWRSTESSTGAKAQTFVCLFGAGSQRRIYFPLSVRMSKPGLPGKGRRRALLFPERGDLNQLPQK